MDSNDRYGGLQMALHWATAALIVGNYFFSEGMEDAFDARMESGAVAGWLPTYHVWAGVTLLALVVLRLIVRVRSGAPAAAQPGVAALAAKVVHMVLYAMMVAVPALGIAAWFFGIDAAANLHVLVMNAMMLLILGHAAMAIFHHFVLRDGLLKRIIPLR
ncbi:MAG: cytochrome b [Candidatus Saccharibacteria bacterium]|nr:cytochrome b [Pseudorhodobacter sp.]